MDLPIKPIPQEAVILGAFAGIKCLDEDGKNTWYLRYSTDLSNEEIIGEMAIMSTHLVHEVLHNFEPDDPE